FPSNNPCRSYKNIFLNLRRSTPVDSLPPSHQSSRQRAARPRGACLSHGLADRAAMIDPVRQEVIALAHTVVVKVGTNVLTSADGLLSPTRIQALADQLQSLRQSGRKVALVSSGAIGAGVGRLGLEGRPTDLRHLQACAAVGQSYLMRAY